MAEKRQEKRIAHLSQKLQGADKKAILAALHDVKKYGDRTILPVLFELLANTNDEEVYNQCLRILQTLKISDAAPAFREAIMQPEFQQEVPHILSAFWQSNQQIGDELAFFVDLSIRTQDYMSAFECLTIIEHTDEQFTDEELMDNIQKLQTEIENKHQHAPVLSSIKDALSNQVIG